MRRYAFLMIGAMLAFAGPAFGQVDVSPAPERPEWIPLTVAIILIGLFFGISMISSKRGHRD